jgi:phosphoglycerol transferase MdoB-like AlkP superfamily enzyme
MQSSLLAPDQGKPKFIYWMTLNSHLPVLINKNLASDDFCHAQPALNSSDALCSWFHLVQTVHQSVAQMALAPGARPTVFVLVGDHAPPFSDPDLVRDFSTTQVPYVMLAPKSLTGKP